MNRKPLPIPDPLRRFTPTPYVFELRVRGDLVRIEADDLEVALAIRQVCRTGDAGGKSPMYWRVIQDTGAPGYEEAVTMFTSGGVKTLLHRSGTILMVDTERREVFGFLGAGLEMQELMGDLLPQLLRTS